MRVNWFLTSRSLLFSIILHIVLGGALIFSFEFSPKPTTTPRPTINIIKAVSVDKKQVELELKRLKDLEKEKKDEELKRQKELEKKAEEAKKKRLDEEKKLKTLKKKKEQEQKKRKKLEKEKKELEKKRKLEEEKKKKTEAEKKKQEELKKKEEERKRKEREQDLQDELKDEFEIKQQQQDLTVLQKYQVLIGRAIENKFNRVGLPEGLSCVILIRMLEGGKVADVVIAKSSGNSLFDKRAETAVEKASPLPAPEEIRVFEKMREIRFTFEPKDIN